MDHHRSPREAFLPHLDHPSCLIWIIPPASYGPPSTGQVEEEVLLSYWADVQTQRAREEEELQEAESTFTSLKAEKEGAEEVTDPNRSQQIPPDPTRSHQISSGPTRSHPRYHSCPGRADCGPREVGSHSIPSPSHIQAVRIADREQADAAWYLKQAEQTAQATRCGGNPSKEDEAAEKVGWRVG